MMPRPWMLRLVGEQTRGHHAGADHDRLAILEQPTADAYRVFLARVLGFEAAVEAACIATAGLDATEVPRLFKANRAAADLGALGVRARDVPSIEPLRFASQLDALAWLYVVHRNTLLHGLIARSLAPQLPAELAVAGSYLTAFDARAGGLARLLGDVLDEVVRGDRSLGHHVVDTACAAFRVQHRWYRRDLGAPLGAHVREVAARHAA